MTAESNIVCQWSWDLDEVQGELESLQGPTRPTRVWRDRSIIIILRSFCPRPYLVELVPDKKTNSWHCRMWGVLSSDDDAELALRVHYATAENPDRIYFTGTYDSLAASLGINFHGDSDDPFETAYALSLCAQEEANYMFPLNRFDNAEVN